MPPGRFSGYHSRKKICWSSDFIFSMKKSRGSVFGWPKLINSKFWLRDIPKIHFWEAFEGYYTQTMSFLNVSERYPAFQKSFSCNLQLWRLNSKMLWLIRRSSGRLPNHPSPFQNMRRMDARWVANVNTRTSNNSGNDSKVNPTYMGWAYCNRYSPSCYGFLFREGGRLRIPPRLKYSSAYRPPAYTFLHCWFH